MPEQPRQFTLIIPGPPRGKGRPRFNRATGRAYTDDQTRSLEESIRAVWREKGSPTVTGPIGICVRCHFARPKAHFKANGELSARGARERWPLKRPDGDNVIKGVNDALNGLAYRDDAEIVRMTVWKVWALEHRPEHMQRMEIEVIELGR